MKTESCYAHADIFSHRTHENIFKKKERKEERKKEKNKTISIESLLF